MKRTSRLCTLLLLTCTLLSLVATAPAVAEKVLYSEPLLIASPEGDNTFEPCEERELTILISNTAEYNEIIDPRFPSVPGTGPLTARGATVHLDTAGTPFTVRTGEFMIGDIRPGEERRIKLLVQADEGAAPGLYELRLSTAYDYISWTTDYGDEIGLTYDSRSTDLPIPLRIKALVRPEIISIQTYNLAPGHTGFINISFRNIGFGTGDRAAADLIMTGSALIPVEGGTYIDKIVPAGVYNISLKATVDRNAPSMETPADFVITYDDKYGISTTSRPVHIGIPVNRGPKFQIVSSPPIFRPGETQKIAVTFKNTGDAPASGAKVRINVMKPFTSATSSAILGDIAPGEEKTASFTLTMAKDAVIKLYGYTAVLKYHDRSGALI
ncbi:MAG: hypothetical protein KAW93_08985, partial [Methanogenium sp.]|nr:hypothetical protein [Methanogenium sp.]